MSEPAKSRPRAIPNRCPEAESAERGAAALERIAVSLEKIEPAAEVVHDFADRLEKLCGFLRKRWPLLVTYLPAIYIVINAISPTAAATFKALLAALPTS